MVKNRAREKVVRALNVAAKACGVTEVSDQAKRNNVKKLIKDDPM